MTEVKEETAAQSPVVLLSREEAGGGESHSYSWKSVGSGPKLLYKELESKMETKMSPGSEENCPCENRKAKMASLKQKPNPSVWDGVAEDPGNHR